MYFPALVGFCLGLGGNFPQSSFWVENGSVRGWGKSFLKDFGFALMFLPKEERQSRMPWLLQVWG